MHDQATLGFIARHNLWTPQQQAAADAIAERVRAGEFTTVRVSVADPQGKLRGKTTLPKTFLSTLTNGLDFSSAQYNFDSGENIAFNPFTTGGSLDMAEMEGFPDLVLVPDPLTFRELPWAPGTGWVLGDMYFNDGTPVPFDARHKLKQVVADLESEGLHYVAGLEVEFYLTRVVDPKLAPADSGALGMPPAPPVVETIGKGYAYQSEVQMDAIDDFLTVVADYADKLGMPLRTMEDELGPGQLEFTFDVLGALEAADTMTLFRSMIKQVSARMGLHATFMTRPGLPGFCASGWHLHQSVSDRDGINLFPAAAGSDDLLSPLGRHFVGGLLEHASAASVFTTPSINGYHRRRPYSLAPDRATWGHDNRAAMCRVQGGPGDPTSHIENRIGEPTANPYLYLGCQIAAGLDGIRRELDPGPVEADPYSATDRPKLPVTLMEAVDELKRSEFFRQTFGNIFVDWLLGLKASEIGRFLEAEPDWEHNPDVVTEWEHREYFTKY
ncbi:glutamine synthetase [Gordonia sp. HNM0687]|uniref:Glutamine synthetase n=1 Tax=Gordonia mangrovi TaxID=2665643 RepID=A0A6L7GJL4_9ACTN|nr:glutamine synthetase family protein [Gordonia mangrovi]MXP20094.1 glutamine synthetase [Gordonia mangrovi]UVF79295.1 glutamine synthetase family protein [Gordonia mangrovi]